MFKNKPRTVNLKTPFEENSILDWTEYPRPQMKRESYLSLCGKWELTDENSSSEIIVPFPPESRISGVGKQLKKYSYKKVFTISEDFNRGKILLHFGAVDAIARVFLNGTFLGEHIGGYLPFSFDITNDVKEENALIVEVEDSLDTDLPYGKQTKKRGGMWYTPISGIWQSVWIESVPESYVSSLKLTPTLNSITITSTGGDGEKTVTINGKESYSYKGDSITISIDDPHLWSPEDPYLYNFTLLCGDDLIESYFALRTVSTKKVGGKAYITLNGEPYFFHGLLDQGYFSDGIYTPYSPEGYIYDIKTMKELGFNMLRKHIKIEPDLFYYYCDKYGMIVFQDMVNSGKYNFFIDTALPTIGLKRGISHKATERRRKQFESDCEKTAEYLYNHPSVCYYTIFNEGWGQYDADGVYKKMKAFDSSRIWDATSGWFKENLSDVESEHIYFKEIKLSPTSERPLVLSEFGGYSCNIEGHCFNLDKVYGYKKFETPEKFSEGLEKLYTDEVVPLAKQGLSAAVLTQVSDVEDETNGLLTYDRHILKVSKETMLRIAGNLFSAFRSSFTK